MCKRKRELEEKNKNKRVIKNNIRNNIKQYSIKIECNCVRVRLCTSTPRDDNNKSNAPATHSQQSKIGVPPILELNNTSFGNRRTIALAYCHIR